MNGLLLVCFLGVGCSKPPPELGCRHMIELVTVELDRAVTAEPDPTMREALERMRVPMIEALRAGLAKCVKSFEHHGIDVDCVLRAKTDAEASKCFPESARNALF